MLRNSSIFLGSLSETDCRCRFGVLPTPCAATHSAIFLSLFLMVNALSPLGSNSGGREETELSSKDVALAQHQLLKLDELDADFKSYHFAIIEEADEQDVLDKHSDRMNCIVSCIQRLITAATSPTPSSAARPNARLEKQLKRIDGDLHGMMKEIHSLRCLKVVSSGR